MKSKAQPRALNRARDAAFGSRYSGQARAGTPTGSPRPACRSCRRSRPNMTSFIPERRTALPLSSEWQIPLQTAPLAAALAYTVVITTDAENYGSKTDIAGNRSGCSYDCLPHNAESADRVAQSRHLGSTHSQRQRSRGSASRSVRYLRNHLPHPPYHDKSESAAGARPPSRANRQRELRTEARAADLAQKG